MLSGLWFGHSHVGGFAASLCWQESREIVSAVTMPTKTIQQAYRFASGFLSEGIFALLDVAELFPPHLSLFPPPTTTTLVTRPLCRTAQKNRP